MPPDPRPLAAALPPRAPARGALRGTHAGLLGLLAVLAGCSRGAPPAAPAGAAGGGQPVAGAPGPGSGDVRLTCAAPEAELGDVREGAVLEHTFELRVEGSAGTAVRAVRADCGCTAADLARAAAETPAAFAPYAVDDPLEPGDRLRVHVRYDTRGKAGSTLREITLYGDFPGGRATLRLHAAVTAWLVAEPDRLSLGRMGSGETREAELTVRSVDGAPFLLHHDRRAVPDALRVEPEPVAPGADGRASRWKVRVLLGKDMPEGAHQYPLYLVSDVPVQPAGVPAPEGVEPRTATTTPALLVQVVGRFLLEPPSLAFDGVHSDATVARTLRLTCHDPGFELRAPVARLEPVEGDDDFPLGKTARVDVRPAPDGVGYDVQVLLDGLAPEVGNRFLARLVLETGHPDEPRLEAFVVGSRAPGELRPDPAGPAGDRPAGATRAPDPGGDGSVPASKGTGDSQ